MAGKSSRGRNRKGPQPVNAVSSDSSLVDSSVTAPANGEMSSSEVNDKKTEEKIQDNVSQQDPVKQADIHLYPVSVKTPGGEKLELQLSPGDSVMDVRQFLLDSPQTCFITCYDLMLHTKDGSTHILEDYNDISEVADITCGSCFLEMIAALYDDRSIRAHIHRTKELLSLSTLHSSRSTMLALQHENGKTSAANIGDAAKTEVQELDSLAFMENITGSLHNLLSSPSKEIKCADSIVFSTFNPPPSCRRLYGDLIYLDVTTLEGNKYCITGTTKNFYVNSSTGYTLDPRPNKSMPDATSLVGLLQKISPKFKKAFREILEHKASAHPFENVQSLLPPNSWLDSHSDHKRDAPRAENSLTLTFGSELIGMQRDWNEELQSCREFPHATHQESILRDRALYKVTSDFVDAATNGAIGVISRCIPPINPTDPECFHMYVHNNIFFSFAVDADLEQLSRKQASEENFKMLSAAPLPDCAEKSESILPQEVSRVPYADTSKPLSPDTSADTHLAESEQATYASSNNDLKGTKAFQEADVAGLYNLAMAIIDYRGHRVVAQSVLPGILQGDKSDSLLYGSVDNGKKICWAEDFHSKVLEAAKRLHLKEHSVLDGSGNTFKIAAPVECKGIVGSDDRRYLLDLMRVTPRDANYTGPGSRFCILRPELISGFCKAEAVKILKNECQSEGGLPLDVSSNGEVTKTEASEEALASVGSNEEATKIEEPKASATSSAEKCHNHSHNGDGSIEILFNPNVFTEFKLAGGQEEITADEENVRKASVYLKDIVLPKLIQDLCSLEVSPMDGQTLTEALHAHGVNIRYIRKVAEGTRHMPHLWDLCSNEIVVRSAKHIIRDILRDTEDHDLAHAISHFFNCFLGKVSTLKGVANSSQSKSQKKVHSGHYASSRSPKEQAKFRDGGFMRKKRSFYLSMSSDSLWSDIQEFSLTKYQFDLPEDARQRVKNISVVRNFCQKVGITIAARKYDFEALAPFQGSDILNIQPIVKHSIPICSEAKNLIENGKVQLAEGLLNEAYNLFSEAFTMLQQVTGPMHVEVANCCRYLAMVLYHAGDMAGAISQQHKELIINERCLGLDHPDTAHSYGNMALFYHGLNQTELALQHMSRALLLLNLSSGPNHPDVAATFINVAMMYQDAGKMDMALRYLQEAIKINERLLGKEHIQTAVCYHALAIAFNFMGTYKLSYQHEKKTYDILLKQLGEDDSRTKESQNWMNQFKMREIQSKAQKEKVQTLDADSAHKAAMDILKANPGLIHAFQAAAAAGKTGSSGSPPKSFNSGITGDTLPRGRGVDERGARAAAEVRKKAAARGLLVRPQGGVPVQPVAPPLSQLLNIISSGMPSHVANTESSGHISNGIQDPEKAPTKSDEQQPRDPEEAPSESDAQQLQVPEEAPTKSDEQRLQAPEEAPTKADELPQGPEKDQTVPDEHEHALEKDRIKPDEPDQAPVGLGSGFASLDAKKQKMKAKPTS